VLELEPTNTLVWNNKANSLNRQGKFRAAYDCCEKGLQTNPEYKELWQNMSIALKGLGKIEEARQIRKKYS